MTLSTKTLGDAAEKMAQDRQMFNGEMDGQNCGAKQPMSMIESQGKFTASGSDGGSCPKTLSKGNGEY